MADWCPLFLSGGFYCSYQALLCHVLSRNITQAEPLCGVIFSRYLRWYSSMCLIPLSQSPSPVLLPFFCSQRAGTAGKGVLHWPSLTCFVKLSWHASDPSFFGKRSFTNESRASELRTSLWLPNILSMWVLVCCDLALLEHPKLIIHPQHTPIPQPAVPKLHLPFPSRQQ